MSQQLDTWCSQIDRVAGAVRRLGGKVEATRTEPPASQQSIKEVEQAISCLLPRSFRRFLNLEASCLKVFWFLPDEPKPPRELRGLFCGACELSLQMLQSCESSRLSWIKNCFPNPDNPYDGVWHDKLAFAEVGNGDLLAFDTAVSDDGPIVYLSHDDGDGHGKRMADNFVDLMERWSPLGCPGSEDWQWIPFCDTSSGLIDPNGPNADRWRQWLGIPT